MLQKMAVVDVPRKNGWQPTSTQETNPTWADADDDEKDADDLWKKCYALVAVTELFTHQRCQRLCALSALVLLSSTM